MSKVGNYGLIILTHPLKPKFMTKYQKTIGPSNKAQSPFTSACPFNQGKRKKPSGKNHPLNIDMKQNLEILSSIMLHSMISNPQQQKLNPSDRTITLTKLLIKHAKFTPKETEIGA